jgi:hypothetical protein
MCVRGAIVRHDGLHAQGENKGAFVRWRCLQMESRPPRSAGGRNSDGRHDVDLRTPQSTGGRMSTEPASRRHGPFDRE